MTIQITIQMRSLDRAADRTVELSFSHCRTGAVFQNHIILLVPVMLSGSRNGFRFRLSALVADISCRPILTTCRLLCHLISFTPGMVIRSQREHLVDDNLITIDAIMPFIPLRLAGSFLLRINTARSMIAGSRDHATPLHNVFTCIADPVTRISVFSTGLLLLIYQRNVCMFLRIDCNRSCVLSSAPQTPMSHYTFLRAGRLLNDKICPIMIVRVDVQGFTADQTA